MCIRDSNTQSAYLFHQPQSSTNKKQFSLYYQGLKFYNSLYNISREISEIWFPRNSGITAKIDGITRLPWNITRGIIAKYHYKSCYYLYKSANSWFFLCLYQNECVFIYSTYHIIIVPWQFTILIEWDWTSAERRLWLLLSVHIWSHSPT